MGQNKVEAAIAELAIRRHLGHRRDFQLMPYDHQKVYDCLITYQTVYLPRQDLPYYRLKQYSSPYELTALEAFLKDLFQQKNTREEELSLSPAAKSSFAHKTV